MARAEWDVRLFAWTDTTHPLNAPEAFKALLLSEPLLRQTTGRLRYMWYRPLAAGWPQNRAALTATTSVDLPDGAYRIRSISDDGIRVYVDDQLVIDDWSVHESRVREAAISSGPHRIRVEYFQDSGWAEIWVEILKRRT
jgi:hypothetical protein